MTSATRPARGITRWISPVVLWALLGAVCLAFGTAMLIRWLPHAEIRVIPHNDYGIGTGRKVALWGVQIAIAVVVAGLVVRQVRQCRRERTITFDTALLLGYILAEWATPWASSYGTGVLTSHYLIHTNSWDLPGWDSSAHPHHTAPVFVTWIGVAGAMLWILTTAAVMKAVTRHRPNLSNTRYLVVSAVVLLLIDLLFEAAWILTGSYSFGDTIPAITLFPGHWYQLPLPGVALTALVWIFIPYAARYYHEREGRETFVLRGIGRLPGRARPWAMTLAVIGLVTLSLLLWAALYNGINALGGAVPATDMPQHFLG
ncbi:spirocyclase AveC family protein [Streptomyces luteireticuli]|uniref:Spirocyclase, AveC family n=1 Tax=Streptomyces luteireticuli TaxID=173858 RepID=A0ABN0YZQ7_9ACTN